MHTIYTGPYGDDYVETRKIKVTGQLRSRVQRNSKELKIIGMENKINFLITRLFNKDSTDTTVTCTSIHHENIPI